MAIPECQSAALIPAGLRRPTAIHRNNGQRKAISQHVIPVSYI